MPPVIPQAELSLRWKAAKQGLEEEGRDALLVPVGIYFNYFFGKQGNPSERLIAGIIPKDQDPFIISPTFEISNIARSTGLDDIVGWEETESPYKITTRELKDRGIGPNIVVDPKLWLLEVERLQESSDNTFVTAESMLNKIRAEKSDWEIKQLQAAAKASSEGILAAIPQLKAGATEKEFLKTIQKELSDRSGSTIAFGLVQFGTNSALPHGMPSDKKLQQDEVVLLDCGTPVNGYQGDITITVPFGKPKGFEEIYQIVYDANRKAFDADKEGVIPSQLDKIARDHITKKGYGEYFTHRLGHGIGLEVHEHPYIVGTNDVPLTNGNCHTIEPGIYIPGKFGVRIEDDVMVSETRADRLFDTPRFNFD